MWNQIEIVYFVSFSVLHIYICDATCQNQALLAKCDSELLYYSTGGCH